MTEAGISLENIVVDGIDTAMRAQSMKHLLLGSGKLGAKIHIPILRDVTLNAKPGDRLALVGHNGSGKSSVLKVIAGIYPPKSGELRVAGKVAPLIEMSVGFEGELSGRANIRMGLLYAGRLSEYSKELEEQIIDFSELRDHIDRPVKGYSSGMRARLSFAVSAFQHPDILLLDEVFAAGDSTFLEKSRKVMKEKFESVPIVILVSHSGLIVKQFCNRCIWMHGGTVRGEGTPEDMLAQYEKHLQ